MIALTEKHYSGYAMGEYNDEHGARTLLGEVIYRATYRKHHSLNEHLGKLAQEFISGHEDMRMADLIAAIPSNRDGDKTLATIVDYVADHTPIRRTHRLLWRAGLISEYSETASANKGKIHVNDMVSLEGKSVLIIDSIMCNGVTVDLAAKALMEAGCREVKALVFSKINRKVLDKF